MSPAGAQDRVTLGILSDTHGLLRPEVLTSLEEVDHILHAGDVGPVWILDELAALAPVTAVWGNTDDFGIRTRVPEVAKVEVAGLRIVVVHGHQFGSPSPERLAGEFPDAGLVVFGHTHQPEAHSIGETWFVNPGSCGPRRFNLPVGLVRGHLEGGRLELETVLLE